MSHKLIDLNQDLLTLRDEGYNVDIYGGYLIVRDIPYVTDKREVRRDGILVDALNLNGDIVNAPKDHTIRFAGEYPCASNGTPIEGIRHGKAPVEIGPRLTVQHSFSAKPPAGNYQNYCGKIGTYTAI